MMIFANTGGVAATNAYLIADDSAKEAVLFDAPDHTVGPLLEKAKQNGFKVIGLWLTHGHFDHIADHAQVTRAFPEAKVLIHRLDEPKLEHPDLMAMFLPFDIPPRRADEYVTDGQRLQIGNLQVEVIHTPGHSPGHVMYHFPNEKVLVGGDLIIMGAVGRTDFPDSDPAELDRSIRRIMQLPEDTHLLPGHGSPSTFADEREANPFVQDALAQR
jgi:glyoxylase-like metal-dependent hydrolase (beta-lactamase superfamily II)